MAVPPQRSHRAVHGTSIYSREPFVPSYPQTHNANGIELTLFKSMSLPNILVVAVYRPPNVPLHHLVNLLTNIHHCHASLTGPTVIIGDFNVNALEPNEGKQLQNLLLKTFKYQQLIHTYTTDYRTTLDHVYISVTARVAGSGVWRVTSVTTSQLGFPFFTNSLISSIKDSARDLAALPQETLEALKKQHKPIKNSPNDNSKNKHHPIAVSNYSECRSVSVLPPQCLPSSAMAGATQRNGARVSASSSSTSRNESKSGKLWNNNNSIELMPRDSKNVHFVISFDILNGNGVASNGSKSVNLTSSNINSSVPNCSSRAALSNSKSVSNKLSNKNKLHNKSKGTAVLPAPYYQDKLLQSAVELIDSKPSAKSSTSPEPAFVDPNKPDQVLQVVAGKPDMAAAASSASTTNTKKTELRGVRLQANKNPLPNGSINNKKSSRGVSSALSAKVNSVVVVNNETPLMGNSQRTDSSVCVKQPTKYGTTVPSNRHLQSAAVDSDEPQDKGGKFVLSSGDSDAGTVANKPTTLGEQFEASKAIEGKKKKSKKKKKNKAALPDAEKVLQQTTAAVANDKVDVFEDALSEFTTTTPKKVVPSSDSITSNEESSKDNAGGSGGSKSTYASKLYDGSFQVDYSKTVPNAEESLSGSADDSTVTNCKKESETKDIKTEDRDTTHKTGAELTTHVQHGKSESDDSKPKLADTENNKMFSNNRNFDSLTLTAHSTDANDPPFVDMDETNAADDDGEFHTVMSSKKRNRLNRKTKGVSMEEKSYPYQNKFESRGGRSGMLSAGMRKSSSEPASMARLGETEHKFPDRNTTNFSINSQDVAADNNKYPLVSQLPPPKPNNDAPSNSGTVTLSYASKVKAGITQHQVQAKNTPVKFTLDDEHSDGHVSDSGIVIPQIDATVSMTAPKSQRTNPSNVHPSNATVMTSNITVDGKTKDEVKPEQPLTAASATTTSGGTSPKFEISFGGFDPVRISHAPKSLKTSCPTMSSSSEGLQSSLRPLQKVARSNSVDGLETDGATISDNSSHQSTTQQHQEANVQYLDLHQSTNTYAGMLKRRLPPSSQGAPPPARRQVVEEPVQVTPSNQVMMEPAQNLESVEKKEYSSKVGVDARPSQPAQVASPQIHDVGKFPVAPAAAPPPALPRVENKSHQELKATYNAGNQVVASPTPSVSSSKGASRSVCIPLSMEPMDLGITFGDVNISEVLKEQEVARQDSPVDKIMADSGAVPSSLPQVPSTGHSCAALETAWRDENKDGSPEVGDVSMAGNQRELGVSFLQMGGGDAITNIGNFNYYEVADMLMKAWTSTLEQKEANPSKVQYYPIDEACI